MIYVDLGQNHSYKERSDGTVISRLCLLSDVAVIDFQGFWLVLLMGHIISCMQTKEDIVNKHYYVQIPNLSKAL
ncbi:hypothetical protein Prudu_011591 [Prunus dulcis]|uniref:Uncharacterized protein n=1 Tax=Prunus dulcis TaxID=3755 RepID=A0A4Y1RBF5_PRUDU|nr:hypothetical protein Prudu_011591 [Prunus dulcis]